MNRSIKLWDMRKFSTTGAQEQIKEVVRRQNWDYRWQNVPYRVSKCDKHVEGDTSLMTYRGHNVLQTLIRCHFSPQFSTGQRYIYTGFYFRFLQINKMLTKDVEQVVRPVECSFTIY